MDTFAFGIAEWQRGDRKGGSRYRRRSVKCSVVRQLLIEEGAKAGAVAEGGWTTLHTATRRGHLDMVQVCLDPLTG